MNFTDGILYRNKKQYLDEIRERILELIESSGVKPNSPNAVYGFVRKGKAKNYGFKSYWMKSFSKKFDSRRCEVVVKRHYDLILGAAANELDLNCRNYKIGVNVEALQAFDEILKPLNESLGYEIEINKKISLEEIEVLYDYIMNHPRN